MSWEGLRIMKYLLLSGTERAESFSNVSVASYGGKST